MSVLIKGVRMPKEGCKDCVMVQRGKVFDTCPFLKQKVNWNVERGGKPSGCPLIDAPDRKFGKWKHGYCSECGYNWGKDAPIASVPNFCPNCGSENGGKR